MAYLETSAALNVNIQKVFELLSGKIYKVYKQKNITKLSNRVSVLSKIENSPETRKKRMKKCCE